MNSVELAQPWTYRTTLVTIDYPAGRHELAKEAYDAAVAAGAINGKKEGSDGDGAAKTGAPQGAGAAEGGQ